MKSQYLKKIVPIIALIGAFSAVITGCGSQESTSEKLQIVATTTMLYDLIDTIAGEQIECVGLMGVGVDPHLYKATAGDVTKLESADMIVYNGLHLEGELVDVLIQFESKGIQVVCASDALSSEDLLEGEEEGELYDPHIWFDVANWKEVAVHVTEGIIELDGDNQDEYTQNLEEYLQELEELEIYINNRTNEISPEQRVIITAHDAFNYLGNAYGYTVMGLQGISTEAETSTGDISKLATYISENEIKAIFIESSVPTKNIEALQEAVNAKGFEVSVGGELYSDSLGNEGDGHNTYVGAFKANIDTIVDSLK